MDLLKKNKNFLLIGFAIVLLFFILRLTNLTLQPIFADEAIYIRWAQVMRAEPTLRFLPLSDGKTPLYMWVLMPVLKIIDDPLFAGRFLSVISGFFTMVGVFLLSNKIFGKRAAFFAAFIYVVTPYTLFFDRMALVDAMLVAFTIWAIYFAVWIIEMPRFDKAMILGFLLGGALLVKTPAMFNLLMLPVVGLGFKRVKLERMYLLKILIYVAIAVVLAYGIYNILRLGPNFQLLSSRNTDYIFSLSDLSKRPLDPFLPHLNDMKEWTMKLITIPTAFFIILGTYFTFLKKNRLGIALIIWALVPMLIQTAMLKTYTARYQLPWTVIFLIFAGVGMDYLLQLFKKYKRSGPIILAVLVSLMPLFIDLKLITKPETADLPKNERRGYLEDWTAGYGFKEIAEFLIAEKKQGPVIVGTEGFFGTLPDGLQIYLDKAGIPIVGGGDSVSEGLREAAKENKVFFVGNKVRVGEIVNSKKIYEFQKAKPLGNFKQDAIVVYQVYP